MLGMIRTGLAAVLLAALASMPTGCGDAAPSGPAAETTTDEPLVFLFQRQRDPEQTRQNAEQAAAFLAEQLGRPVEAVVPGSYSASVQALVSGQADVAYLSALPFLLARRDGGAELILAEVRPDLEGNQRTNYDSVWVARADSPIESLDQVAAAAGQLRVCFTSRTSTSGYVMATLRLAREGLIAPAQDPAEVFAGVSFAGGYTQALQEVLLGRADIAAVSHYTVEGPTADLYTTSDERDRLRVIARTPEVPTHLVATRGGLPAALKDEMTDALIALSDARPDLLENVYGASSLRRVDEDEHVRAAVEAVEAVGLPIDDLAG